MKSIRRVVADEGVDKSSWWYYFKKSEDGNYAKCNSCDWVKDRGAARSTSILRCHLKAKHPELLTEKLQADKELGNKFKRQVSKKIKLEAGEGGGSGNDGEEEGEALGESQERKNIGASPAQSQVSLSELLEQTFSPVKVEHQTAKLEDNIEDQLLKQTNDFNNALLSMIAADFVSNSATTNGNQQPGTSGSNAHSQNVTQTNKGTSGGTAVAETAGHFTWAGQKPPVVQLRRKEHFSSAHRLHNPKFDAELNAQLFGKCNNANGHGHNYCWEVVLQGEVDASTGMVYNLADLKQEMASVLALVDHKNLDLDVAYFSDNSVVSTTENLAIFLYHELAARMTRPELLKQVLVGETSKNSFIYSGPSNSCSI